MLAWKLVGKTPGSGQIAGNMGTLAGVAVGESVVRIKLEVEVEAAGTITGGEVEMGNVVEMVANSHTTGHNT